MPKVIGSYDAKFESLNRAFNENLERGDDIGAALVVMHNGACVVNLAGGYADQAKTRLWQPDTMATLMSATKAFTAACAHRLVDQGLLDLDAPVAKYWPEFAVAGKESMPVGYLLSHRAGLAAFRPQMQPDDIYDWDKVTSILAEQEPFWTPGEKHGYHSLTFGWLVGEVVKRVSGKSLGRYFRDEIGKPLALDAWIGVDPSRFYQLAEMGPFPAPDPAVVEMLQANPESVLALGSSNPPTLGIPGTLNSDAWRSSEIPAANGHASAYALAKFYAALANGGTIGGVHVLSPESIARCREEQSFGVDEFFGATTRFGLGYILNYELSNYGPNPLAFGHCGFGGTLGFCDPEENISFGYVVNKMDEGFWLPEKCSRLIAELYNCVGACGQR